MDYSRMIERLLRLAVSIRLCFAHFYSNSLQQYELRRKRHEWIQNPACHLLSASNIRFPTTFSGWYSSTGFSIHPWILWLSFWDLETENSTETGGMSLWIYVIWVDIYSIIVSIYPLVYHSYWIDVLRRWTEMLVCIYVLKCLYVYMCVCLCLAYVFHFMSFFHFLSILFRNSETVTYFWQNWNIPVHKWCIR